VEQAVFLPRSSLFMVGKAQKSHGERSGLHRLDGWVVGFLIHFFQAKHRIQSRNPEPPLRKQLLPHPKGDRNSNYNDGWLHEDPSTFTLPPPLQVGITVTASLCIKAAHFLQSTNFSNGPCIYYS
jgi:hypothetical protein